LQWRYVHADPYKGAMIAVSEAARNIACTGGEPCGVTNCLNFGNPYDPEVYWQFAQAIKGMGDACREFDTPGDRRQRELLQPEPSTARTWPCFPTPTIGMVGPGARYHQAHEPRLQTKATSSSSSAPVTDDIACSEYLVRTTTCERSPCAVLRSGRRTPHAGGRGAFDQAWHQ
jgi:phosphoribosylformylglycinamidine (FGAM) synthase-like enzyme